jgi:adenosine deaminase
VEPETAAKVDLHRHLEGSIRLQTLIDLYRDAGEPLPETTSDALASRAQVLKPMASLEAVLAVFGVAQRAFFEPEAAERIAYEAVEDCAADDVRLAELRFSPHFLCEPHSLDWDEAMDAIIRGVDRASREHDVAVGLIAIVSRNYGMESAQRTVEFAVRHRDELVGFDLAGDEQPYPPSMYVDALEPVVKARLPITAHYGESGGPHFPREAIEALGAVRLGHGVSIADDPEVTALARDEGITLEMCPTSNVRTHAVARLEEHPARRLLDEGLRVTINTDNPGLFDVDLTHELEACRSALRFTDDDVRRITQNALDASFVDESVKADVRRRHLAWLDA